MEEEMEGEGSLVVGRMPHHTGRRDDTACGWLAALSAKKPISNSHQPREALKCLVASLSATTPADEELLGSNQRLLPF
jgi:hypothetical protein